MVRVQPPADTVLLTSLKPSGSLMTRTSPASGTSRNQNLARIHNDTKKFLCGFILEKAVNHRWTQINTDYSRS